MVLFSLGDTLWVDARFVAPQCFRLSTRGTQYLQVTLLLLPPPNSCMDYFWSMSMAPEGALFLPTPEVHFLGWEKRSKVYKGAKGEAYQSEPCWRRLQSVRHPPRRFLWMLKGDWTWGAASQLFQAWDRTAGDVGGGNPGPQAGWEALETAGQGEEGPGGCTESRCVSRGQWASGKGQMGQLTQWPSRLACRSCVRLTCRLPSPSASPAIEPAKCCPDEKAEPRPICSELAQALSPPPLCPPHPTEKQRGLETAAPPCPALPARGTINAFHHTQVPFYDLPIHPSIFS